MNLKFFLITFICLLFGECQKGKTSHPYKLIIFNKDRDTSGIQIYDENENLRISIAFSNNKRESKLYASKNWPFLPVLWHKYSEKDTTTTKYFIASSNEFEILHIFTNPFDTVGISKYKVKGNRYWGDFYAYPSDSVLYTSYNYESDFLDTNITVLGNDTFAVVCKSIYDGYSIFNMRYETYTYIDTTFNDLHKRLVYYCDNNPGSDCSLTNSKRIVTEPYNGTFFDFKD